MTDVPNSGGQKEFQIFSDLESFTQAVSAASGIKFDFAALTELTTNFIQASEQYLILNIKDYNSPSPDNLLFLTQDQSFLFSREPGALETYTYKGFLSQPFGKSTVLAFLILNKVLDSYERRLESLIGMVKEIENNFDIKKYQNLTFELERLFDWLEEFHELLLRLEERRIKQVEIRYISFDYRVLLSESLSLQNRCRRRLGMLRQLERDYEVRTTMELNQRIEKLNDIVKRLTALTVIFMIPTLIASHFGMNFVYMPELRVWWAYPTVIGVQIFLVGLGIFIFRKLGWL